MYISGATCPHSPTLPFPEHAGEWRKEMDREREPVHPASLPVDCTSSKREKLQACPRRREERAQNVADTRESGGRANSQNFQPSRHPILLQDLGQIAHPIFAPIYSSEHVWDPFTAPAPSGCPLHTSVCYCCSPSPQVSGQEPWRLRVSACRKRESWF